MRIRRLELTGFKSFSERTVFQFSQGISCIVGPNGCGKSNVIDAIRWILGEQNARRLRGEGMDDVIFGGSSASAATGVAEAILVLDNSSGELGEQFTQFAEVEVGRRLYRDGESVYLLNGVRCRLRDVTDLFMDTGVGARAFSVIEQGRVVSLISSRPQDRRVLLEEAAGIVGYKARRLEAQRRLDSTEQNLLRVGDVASELRRQMNALKRQATKANRFRRLQVARKESELLLILAETRLQTDRYRQWHEQLTDLEGAREDLLRAEGDLTVRQEAQRDSLRNATSAVDEIKERLAHLKADVQTREREREFATREIRRLEERLEALGREAVDSQERNKLLADEEKELLLAEEACERELLSRSEEQQERDAEMVRLDGALRAALEEIEALGVRSEQGVNRIAALRSELSEIDHRLQDYRAREEILQRERAEAQTNLEDCRGRVATIEEQLGEIEAEAGARRARLADMEDELEGRHGAWAAMMTAIDELSRLIREREARKQSLGEVLQRFEGFHAGVREMMKRRSEEGAGVLGTLADVVEVSPQYEKAIEAVLGEALQYVLVQQQADGVDSLAHLQDKGVGRTSLVPVESVRPLEGGSRVRGRGVVADALDIVRVAEEFEPVAQHLLGEVTLVETLTDALRLFERGKVRRTLVTLAGEVVDPGGVLTGGVRREGGLLGQKRELRLLEAELGDLRSQEAEAGTARDEISHAMDQLTREREAVQGEIHDLEVRRAGFSADLQAATREVGVAVRRIEAFDAEQERMAPAIDELVGTARQVGGALEEAELDRATVRERLAEHEGRTRELRVARDERRGKAFDARLASTAARERLEGVKQRRRQLDDSRADVRTKIEREQTERVRVGRSIDDHERQARELAVQAERCAKAYESAAVDLERSVSHKDGIAAQGIEAEKELREMGRRRGVLQQKIQEASSQVAVLNAELGHLSDRLRSRFDLDLKGLFARLESEGGVEVVLRGALPRPLGDDEAREPDAAETMDRDEEALAQGVRVRFEWDQLLAEDELAERRDALARIRSELDRIGEINMGAPEAYQEVKVEHDKLRAQMDDLEASVERIRRGIAKLNRESKERFARAFESVDRHFRELYPRLNGGGKAHLELTDPDDLLETGVEVNVQPPGKKLKAMGLLSGGEKAMAAISLLFAVFLHRPSPFCLLDEVDAELDEANVRRVCHLLREMRARTQFVVISHKRQTMEAADILFGVTMEKAGVSKLVTVKLEDVA